MKLQDLINEVKKLSPHDIVKCGLDSFAPYSYIELPDHLQNMYKNLSPSDQEKFDDWEFDQLDSLRDSGKWGD